MPSVRRSRHTLDRTSWSAFNQAVCGLRFLYHITLRRPWVVQHAMAWDGLHWYRQPPDR